MSRFRQYDLDAHILYTNAPGYSAYNRVERRMAPLSKELSGLVLLHDACGAHLDESGTTIDTDLERENFKKAGQVLADVWSGIVIDSFSAHAEFVENAEVSVEYPDENWVVNHVRQSQYVLQIVRCNETLGAVNHGVQIGWM